MISDSKYCLAATNLNVGFSFKGGENCLFQNLNLQLYPGQLVCFMGPNGIGKSTVIRTLAGLQKPLAGNITIASGQQNNHVSKQISVVLTDKIPAVNMTAYEVIAFGRYPYLEWNIRLRESDNQIIDRAIAQVHIEHLVDQKLHELSDGQLQMVMIARALAQETPIILLDEPTAHLDLNNRVEVMKLLRHLAQTTNKAILVASHELDLALQLADFIWLTDRDKTILTGIPEDLVLNGAFDRIFEFKGFDLKTGKVLHEAYTGKTVQLLGAGPEFLWTKNALERTGFEVRADARATSISIIREDNRLAWLIRKSGSETVVNSLRELINIL